MAKTLKINRNVVAYRINRLEKAGIIQRYITSVDLGLLGYQTYKVYMKTQVVDKAIESRFISYVTRSSSVIHFLKTEGNYNYTITIAVKNFKGLDSLLMDVKNEFKGLIKDFSVSILIYSRVFKLTKILLGKSNELKFEKYSLDEKKVSIDDKDILILKVLNQNANISIIDIAAKTQLTVDIVKYRLKKLPAINSFRIMIDMNSLGYYHYILLVKMRPVTMKDESRIFQWCLQRKNVLYYNKRIGLFDFEINAAIRDIKELNGLVDDFKKEFNELIDSYQTLLNTELLKLNYFPFN